jgi:hypothetical protein
MLHKLVYAHFKLNYAVVLFLIIKQDTMVCENFHFGSCCETLFLLRDLIIQECSLVEEIQGFLVMHSLCCLYNVNIFNCSNLERLRF